MFPAMALLMGNRVAIMRDRTLFWQLAPMLLLGLVWLGLALNAGEFADTPQQAELYPKFGTWVMVAALIFLTGMLGGLAMLWRQKKAMAMVVLTVATIMSAQVGLSGYNETARDRSAKHIAEAIRDQVRPDIPFYSVLTYEWTFAFYLKRIFTLVEYQDEMGFGIQQEPRRWIPTVDEFVPVWEAQPEAFAIMPVDAYPRLQQKGLDMKVIFQDGQFVVVRKP
jgi:hypothetical protein